MAERFKEVTVAVEDGKTIEEALHDVVLGIAMKQKSWQKDGKARISGYVTVELLPAEPGQPTPLRKCMCTYCWDDEATQTCRCIPCKCG